MNSKPPSWRDTLLDYLASSNEDSQIISYFEQSVIPKIRLREKLVWLDIGPGPGTKTFGIYRALLNGGIHVKEAWGIDPDPTWRQEFSLRANDLMQDHPSAQQFVLSPTSLRDLSQTQPMGLVQPEPNFITCIHLLYGASLIEDFGVYLSHRLSYCACIVVEASASALWQMRKTINETFGIGVPLGAECAVRKMLTDQGVRFREDLIVGETCHIRSGEDVREWLLPFVLGVSRQEMDKFRQQTVTRLTKFVEEYVAKQNWILSVPDVAFLVENY